MDNDKNKIIPPTLITEKEWDWYKEKYTGKIIPVQYEKFEPLYRCNSCEQEIFLDNYCSKCGQKLR